MILAKKLKRGSGWMVNDQYLNPQLFTEQFYVPAAELLDRWLAGFIFEQEYQRKQDRPTTEQLAETLDRFFKAVPKDNRYHLELRTDAFLTKPVFEVLSAHGIGQVLSHWTWLPSLSRQFSLAGQRFFNTGATCIIRLMTPRGMRYEEAYARAHPFDALIEGMLTPNMLPETVDLMRKAIAEEVQAHVIINNRSGGNAPLIAGQVAKQFLLSLNGVKG
jgi:hypothetical protein